MMLDTERDVPRSRSHQALSTCWLRSQRAAAWHGVLPTQWQGVLPTQYNPWHGKSHVWREIGRQVEPRGIESENGGKCGDDDLISDDDDGYDDGDDGDDDDDGHDDDGDDDGVGKKPIGARLRLLYSLQFERVV